MATLLSCPPSSPTNPEVLSCRKTLAWKQGGRPRLQLPWELRPKRRENIVPMLEAEALDCSAGLLGEKSVIRTQSRHGGGCPATASTPDGAGACRPGRGSRSPDPTLASPMSWHLIWYLWSRTSLLQKCSSTTKQRPLGSQHRACA